MCSSRPSSSGVFVVPLFFTATTQEEEAKAGRMYVRTHRDDKYEITKMTMKNT